MQAQADTRISKRMTCAVTVGARRYAGLVLNVSRGGLFVQTSADPGHGDSVALELNAPGSRGAIPMRATVVWKRLVPPRLRSLAQGGLGVRIQQADETYYRLLAGWMREDPKRADRPRGPSAATADADEPFDLTSYRVRVRSVAGPRTRTLTIEARSVEAARGEALRYVGEGWRVIDVEAL